MSDKQPPSVATEVSEGAATSGSASDRRLVCQCRSLRANDPDEDEDELLAESRMRDPVEDGKLSKKLKMTVPPGVDLSVFDDDLMVGALSFLGTHDLVSLAKTSKRFSLSQEGQPSLIERAASWAFMNSASVEEKTRLPKYTNESHLELLRQLEIGRENLGFDLLVGDSFEHVDTLMTSKVYSNVMVVDCCMAVCRRNVMRAGRHFAQFNQTKSGFDMGVIRPIDRSRFEADSSDFAFGSLPFYPMPASSLVPTLSLEDRERCHAHLLAAKSDRWKGNVHCASFYDEDFLAEWSDWNACGIKDMPIGDDIDGDVFGLLLDLDTGTLSLFLDGKYVGLIKDGLAGEYCWFICAYIVGGIYTITRKEVPPTESSMSE